MLRCAPSPASSSSLLVSSELEELLSLAELLAAKYSSSAPSSDLSMPSKPDASCSRSAISVGSDPTAAAAAAASGEPDIMPAAKTL